ncbi:NAD(P)/FAD-dependent oxidoreductase [Rhodococcus fascians]|nr:NAD(P)/FAD-dependent oxidoreductase [Rhodococcus fascians]MBY4240434.1 NAD(P)/FAD-dependent oxidoreductase [Rhodococcus fascians]MBY4256101.1 NAD(P)/FAD-dependent oxidoreductase [Rhodococcus fascians]MBY4271828.1 NAD(P)/FAD-dependent oxidoreductase [Rhodococcus fascians]
MYDVLIIGGGNAGISAAARLLKKGVSDVAVIEPKQVHTYKPLLSYVGAGQAPLTEAERTQRSVIPEGCVWLEDSVVSVDPAARSVRCASGMEYGYRDLVLGQGLIADEAALPGVHAALRFSDVASNYLDRAERTWRLVRDLPAHSHAVFTVPRPPVGCTGTTVKPLFLAAAHWKRTGRLPTVDITLVVDRESLIGVPDLDPRLAGHLRDLGVRVLMDTAVTALEPESKRITVTDHAGVDERIDYDMLHLVPPYRGPLWVQESGLAGKQPHGIVDIDSRTMRHRLHPEVWAAGDGAAIDTDSSGGALRKQISILVDNLVASRSGGAMSSYDGYTVAPIAVEAHTLIAAEFDRTGALASSLPSFLDPLKPRRSAWAFDRYGLPQSYWHMILAGRL